MPRLLMTVKGSPKDHEILSESVSEEDAKDHLAKASRALGTAESIDLPGVAAQGLNVLAVRVVPDSHGQPVAF